MAKRRSAALFAAVGLVLALGARPPRVIASSVLVSNPAWQFIGPLPITACRPSTEVLWRPARLFMQPGG